MPNKKVLVDHAMYEALGLAIRDARVAKVPRLTQEKLAAAIGVDRTTIANIELGRQHVLVHTLLRIARALDVTLDKLIPKHDRSNGVTSNGSTDMDSKLQALSPSLRKKINEKVSS
jgi:transcriptional regulator with XRE-family HTH domain